MKDKIKNGYFFKYNLCGEHQFLMRVGSRCYFIPLYSVRDLYVMFKKDIVEEFILEVYKPNGERVEWR